MKKIQTSRSEGLAMISSWKSSGKTSRQYCEEQNITYHRLQYWHGVYKRQQGGDASRVGQTKFIPITVNAEDSSKPVLEIRTPSGYSIRIFDAVSLSELIPLLK